MTLDQAFVPSTRSQLGLPAFDPTQENILGSSISDKVKRELRDALGDSPLGATLGVAGYFVRIYRIAFYCVSSSFILLSQIWGWPAYLICNATGQRRYPAGTNRQWALICL